MELTLKQKDALQELIAVSRVSSKLEHYPKEVCEKIDKASNIIEEMLFNAEIDDTDWDYIDNLADSLIKFGEVS